MTAMHVASMLWLLWYASWIAAMFWSNRPAKRLGFHREMVSRLLTGVGVILLFFYPSPRSEGAVIGPAVAREAAWPLLVVVAFGFVFAWWARIHLGRLWSGNITRKPDHRVVDTGPYRIVRHPIYSGLMLSALATAAIGGRLSAIAGAILFALAFYLKARLEERFLRQELGAAYDEYARRVGMLVPFVRS